MNEKHSTEAEIQALRTAKLIGNFIKGSLSDAERKELDEWILSSPQNAELFAELTTEENIEQALIDRDKFDTNKAWQKWQQKNGQRKPSLLKRIAPLAIAASILITAGIIWFTQSKETPKPPIAIAETTDIAPGTNKAALTLSDGRTIMLDAKANGQLENDNGTAINKTGDAISYENISSATADAWNTLTVPKGGQYKLTLPDGTNVWLNAESSLHYPVGFAGTTREVELTGEAYFEVAKNPSKPFRVKAGGAVTEVLGTHFNINTYKDETSTKITLTEGAVRVVKGSDAVTIRPGQQVMVAADNKLQTINAIDIDEVLAWKNGYFEFKDADINTIMRQVARWYNVDVKMEGMVPDHFNASVERSVPVSKLFSYLQQTGRVHFEIKDRTIIVKP